MGDIFFQTIDELQDYEAVFSSLSLDTMKPYVEKAQLEFLKPLLSNTYYATILAKYNAVTPNYTANEQDLVNKIQRAMAGLSLYLAAPVLNVAISDAGGITVQQTSTHVVASQWRVEQFRKAVNDSGNKALDDMLEFLEENKSSFAVWAASSAYTELKEFFINTTKDFQKYVNIRSSRLTFLAMRPVMRKVHDFIFRSELGDNYYDELIAQIKANTVTAANEIIMKNLRPAAAHLTIARALEDLSMEITNNAIIVNTYKAVNDNMVEQNPARQEVISALRTRYETDGQTYLKRAIDYLNANASASSYATYFNGGAYVEPDADDTGSFSNDEDDKIYIL